MPHLKIFNANQGTILGLFNMFSGGALERMSILALGIMPYISASIIVQLMSTVIPSLEALKKKANKASVRLINIRDRVHCSLHSCRQLGCVLV
jgi:preprotein translocase subunit SecY